jgi:DNA ligase (NAD+)
LKPRVRIEPVRLGGVSIEYATGFNGKFIQDNQIGIGAIIQIIRSGDVIPHIRAVSVPAERTKMPTVPYHWTETRIDIVLDNVEEDETVLEKNITAFFTGIGVDGLSSGNVRRIMKSGHKTVPQIIKLSKADLAKVDGFQMKMVDKIYDGIRAKLDEADLITLMAASNLFGRGIGKLKITPIISNFPNILTSPESSDEKIRMVKTVKGIGEENAKGFVSNIPRFVDFMREADLMHKISAPPVEATFVGTADPLYGKHIVMTKIRDAGIIAHVERVGGIIDNAIGKKTDILITKSMEDVSVKTKYAQEHNIPIFTPETFRMKYIV